MKPYSAGSSPAHTFKGARKFIPAAPVVSTSVNKRQLYINGAPFKSLDNSELLFNAKALPTLFIPEPSSAYQTHTVITPGQHLHLLFFIFLCHPWRGREGWMWKFTRPRLVLDTVIGCLRVLGFFRGVRPYWFFFQMQDYFYSWLLARKMNCNNTR